MGENTANLIENRKVELKRQKKGESRRLGDGGGGKLGE